jgi:RNA polymerase sigma factor (sigma-70 family)
MHQLTDRQLLNRFAHKGDNVAFALLMQRHGPEVLRRCKRILGQDADAEDALQATFAILARHAGSRQWKQSIGHWLFRVAYCTALKMRESQEDRPMALKEEPAQTSGFLNELDLHELGQILLEELDGLPSVYRQPLVLCYLRGFRQEEAARRLGMPRRTLQRQLERGRVRLRRRLIKRGLTGSICRVALRIEDCIFAWLNQSKADPDLSGSGPRFEDSLP